MAAKKATNHKHQAHNFDSSVARQEDGTIQITLTIPWEEVSAQLKRTAQELGKETTVPGFRKGAAPIERLLTHLSQDTLTQHTLNKLLPHLFGHICEDNKIVPIMYPRFEILKANQDEPWEIRILTCEFPEINLGDYKKIVKGVGASAAIWTPEKGKPEETKEPTHEQKQEAVLKAITDAVEVKIPAILIQTETDEKLTSLLERLEKLGLTLENYLTSINKTPAQLRQEYADTSAQVMKLEFILGKIANEQKYEVTEKEIESFATGSGITPSAEQKRAITSILLKQKAIDHLVSLSA